MKRAARKLKLWSKFMKRGRKTGAHHHQHETQHSSSNSPWQPQPSAPPLPPPEELERLHSAALGHHPPPPFVTPRSPSDVTILLCVPVNLAITTTTTTFPGSYQQYLAPSPVVGVPFQPAAIREGNSNLGACFGDFAAFLNQCLCSSCSH